LQQRPIRRYLHQTPPKFFERAPHNQMDHYAAASSSQKELPFPKKTTGQDNLFLFRPFTVQSAPIGGLNSRLQHWSLPVYFSVRNSIYVQKTICAG
jgi:hypothetical protein